MTLEEELNDPRFGPPRKPMSTEPTPPCSTHPDAPHGFDRNGSHTAGRYVCDCEGWIPPQPEPQQTCPECIRGAVPMFDGHGNEIGLGHCEACDGF